MGQHNLEVAFVLPYPAALGSIHDSGVLFRIIDDAKLVKSSAMLRDSATCLIVDKNPSSAGFGQFGTLVQRL